METVIDFLGLSFIQSQLPRFSVGFQLTLAIALVSMVCAVLWGLVLVG
jgi:ABC-type amino acid transport system permease subunit